MVTIEKITNGYIVNFKNTNNQTVKLFFPDLETFSTWLKEQFEGKKDNK